MTPFSTTVCTQIRLIRGLVTIGQLLQSYLASQRRQFDLQEQHIQSDARKAQFQSCYAARHGKGTQQTSKNKFRSILKTSQAEAIAIMHQSSLLLIISNNITTLRYRDFCALLLLYVAHALQQYPIGSTSISSSLINRYCYD